MMPDGDTKEIKDELTTRKLPILTVKNRFLFPGSTLTLEFQDAKNINAITYSGQYFNDEVLITVVEENNKLAEGVAVLAKIVSYNKIDSTTNHIKANLRGIERVNVYSYSQESELFLAAVFSNANMYTSNHEELGVLLRKAHQVIVNADKAFYRPNSVRIQTAVNNRTVIENIIKSGTLKSFEIDIIAATYPFLDIYKKLIFKSLDYNFACENLIIGLESSINNFEIEEKINRTLQKKIDKNNKDYYLREKIKVIKEELGDIADKDIDAQAIRQRIDEEPFPERIKERLLNELKRFESAGGSMQEAHVQRTYLDWLLSIPWYQETVDTDDFKMVEKVLNENHYGLVKPKERILEYLAVRSYAKNPKAPIICLIGPPGVGKTSLGISIAKALNKKFVKISLGGVADEAEIRGHRRTYIGALPGRIIEGMKKAGVLNPVFLLDEVDKIGKDYKGDPAAALLEVLDPEQNNTFNDHYIEEPYDLSKVMFICTANYLDRVPRPLLDRLEVIQLYSYTELEKHHIAKDYLLTKVAKENGIKDGKISFTDGAIKKIIREYTRESGVRQLERLIGNIVRKIILKTLLNDAKASDIEIKVNEKDIVKFLGKEKFVTSMAEKVDQIGVVTGLAYTEAGGDILPIEVNSFPGSGKLVLTGSLGDVMKESANIALDFVKAHLDQFKIYDVDFSKIDIHIHVPEGATPKDGPSAGVTITTALISALSKRKARADIAMTGEITLVGKVLPIGGLKEKSISAHRSMIKTIFIPKENERDLEDVPEEVKKELEIVLVDNISQILERTLVD